MIADTDPRRSDAYGRCLLCRTMVFVGEMHECLVEERITQIIRAEIVKADAARVAREKTGGVVREGHWPTQAPVVGCNCEMCEMKRGHGPKSGSGA